MVFLPPTPSSALKAALSITSQFCQQQPFPTTRKIRSSKIQHSCTNKKKKLIQKWYRPLCESRINDVAKMTAEKVL
jgi:hypothetical protein